MTMYVPVWQRKVFCLCTTAENQTVTSNATGCGNSDTSQDTKVKAEHLQQVQDSTCSALAPFLEKTVISA